MTQLVGINVRSGVNEEGAGFCTVVAEGSGGRLFVGQLDPNEVRLMALQFLEVAEAADQDGAVLRATRQLKLPDDLASAILVELRNSRSP